LGIGRLGQTQIILNPQYVNKYLGKLFGFHLPNVQLVMAYGVVIIILKTEGGYLQLLKSVTYLPTTGHWPLVQQSPV